MSPVVSVKSAKDARKIVELSDTGCDARLSVPKVLRNTGRYHSPELSKMKPNEDWKPRYDEDTANKSRGERFRAQRVYDTMDTGKCYFVPRKSGTSQQYWPKYSQYENAVAGAQVRGRSEAKDFKSKLRPPTTESRRTRRWRHDNDPYEISSAHFHYDRDATPQDVPKNMKYLPRDLPKGSNINERDKKYTRYNYPKADSNVFSNKEKVKPREENHPEYLQPREIPQNSSRCYKKYWQTLNSPALDDTENLNEMSQKDHRYSRHHSRNTRDASSAKSNDTSRDYDETVAASRIRSRTCSPPNRRNRTRPSPEEFRENVDQFENRYEVLRNNDSNYASERSRFSREKNEHSNDSVNSIEQFVDRAVDRDSLSDMPHACTSTEPLSNSTVAADTSKNVNETSNLRSSFWEFIPLADEDDEKIAGRVSSNRNSYPLAELLSKDNSNSRTKRRPVGKTIADHRLTRRRDSANLRSYDNSTPLVNVESTAETTSNEKKLRTEAKLYSSPERSHVAPSSVNKNAKILDNLRSPVETISQTRIARNLNFGWTDRPSQLLKRPNSASKSEPSSDKKKKTENTRYGLHVASNRKAKTVVESTAACLNRKFDKSRIEEGSTTSSKHSNAITERRMGSEGSNDSKLPIRIGNHHRSRSPNAQRFRFNVKSRVSEENKRTKTKELPADSCGEAGSVRSRTKPRIKPSVIHNRAVVDSTETSGDCKSTGNVQSGSDTRNSFEDDPKGKFMDNRVDEKSSNRVNVETDSPILTFLRKEKLDVNTENGGVDDLTRSNMEEDQRRRNMANRGCGREMNQKSNLAKEIAGIWRNGFKEKCFFRLNDEEDVVCNGYCNKDSKSPNYFHVAKPAEVRSQF
ncbi:hypothetical protein WH47_05573 [Habropoda laboriosa]|uniref:Uncharacterized protein n=1 Tax=Habropoda laboriosa TaxID=597456 RepID=A0A0L7QTS5_9HYME|nr:hypothetical protein WH47_05573 [Habropoda laboriosa]